MINPALDIILRGGFDPDASRFFVAAGITDGAQKRAVNNMVLSLKGESLWSLFYALYPIVGGNATAHAQNLASANYPITWVNAPTQDANGVTFNGSTQYGNCVGLTAGTVWPHLCGMTCYNRTTNNTSSGVQRRHMGLTTDGSTKLYFLEYVDNTGIENNRAFAGALGSVIAVGGTTEYTGCISFSRTSSTAMALYNNGASMATNVVSDTTTQTAADVYVGAMNDGGSPGSYSAENYGMFAVHNGMTAAQTLALHTIIETYQDALGRGVV